MEAVKLFQKSHVRFETITNFLLNAEAVDNDSENVINLLQKTIAIFLLAFSATLAACGIFVIMRVLTFYFIFTLMSQGLQWLTLSATVTQTNYIRSISRTFRQFFLHEPRVPLALMKPPREFDGAVRAIWHGRHKKTLRLVFLSLAVFLGALIVAFVAVIVYSVFFMREFAAVRENQKLSLQLIKDARACQILRNIVKEAIFGPRPFVISSVYPDFLSHFNIIESPPIKAKLAMRFEQILARPICESRFLKGVLIGEVAVTNEKMTIEEFCEKFLENSIDKKYSMLKVKFASTMQTLVEQAKKGDYSKDDFLFGDTLCDLLVDFIGQTIYHLNIEGKAFLSEIFVHSLLFVVVCVFAGGTVYLLVRFVSLRIWQNLYTQHRSIYIHFLPWRVAEINHQLRSIINGLKPPSE